MSGRTTACAWLTAWAIESSHSDHVGRTSNVPDRVVAPGSIGKGVGDATRLIAVDHRAPRLTPWPAPWNRQGAETHRDQASGPEVSVGPRTPGRARDDARRCNPGHARQP